MSADPHDTELHYVSLVHTEVKVEPDFNNPEDDPPDQFYSTSGDQGETIAVVKHEETKRKSRRVQHLLSLSDLESWDDMNDGDWKCDVVKVKSKKKKGKSTKRTLKSKENGMERRRKLIKDMTPEEREMQRSKWRNESRRKREVKKMQGNNLEAEDGVVSKKPAKGISDVTPEKQEVVNERRRKKSRQNRESGRMSRDEIEAISNSDDVDDSVGNGDKGRPKVSRISKQSCKLQGSRKKKVSEMTPEELEASRTKWREKKKKVSEMTPEELTIYREKSREKMRKWRERKRKEQMTPEEKEKLKKKVNERSRSYRAKLSDEAKKRINERLRHKRSQMSEQERQEKLQRNKLWYLQNKAKMTEEQLAIERMKNYMRYVARRARMTPEEIKAEQLKNYQTKRRRFENMTEEEKQKYRERLNERCRIYKRSRKQRRKWEKVKVKPNETQEERRERLNSISHRKAVRRRMTVKQMLDSGMTMDEVNQKFQIEANERRERRLAINRKSLEKAKLKKQLLATGVSEEEIEAQLKEFSDNYQFEGRKREIKRVKHQRINLEDFNMPSDSNPVPPAVTSVMEKEANVASPAVGLKASLENNVNAIHMSPLPDSVNLNNYVHEDVTSQTTCSFASTPENEEIFASSLQPLRPDQTSQFEYQYTSISQNHLNHQFQEPQLSLQYETLSTSYTQAPDYTPYDNAPLTTLSSSTVPAEHNHVSQEIKSDCFPTAPTKRKLGRPRKGDPTHTKKKKGDGPKRVLLGMPIGSRRIENRDEICDECGNAYSAVYLKAHKRHMHNSNFKNGECTICGEKFKRSEHFYLHWRRKHCADARAKTGAQKTYMCQDCGKLFQSGGSLQAHWNQEHGPGSLKDNFLKCSICPNPKKLYKTKLLLQLHMQNCHKGYEMYECVRCPEKFRSNKDLNDHIMGKHPDSYWPCKYCNTVKYTELGLTFHYSDRKCHKIPKEELEKIRKEIGNSSVDRFPFQCNFCDQEVQCAGLNKHYRKVHGVGQDEFQCVKCDKSFKKREYWGVHMIDIHNVDVEECKEIMNKNKFNLKNMTNVTIKNLGKKKGRLKTVKAAGRGRDGGRTRGRKKKCVDNTDDGKEDDGEGEIDVKWKKRKELDGLKSDKKKSVSSSLSEVEIPRQLRNSQRKNRQKNRRDCGDDGMESDDKYASKPIADTVTLTNLRQSALILEEGGKKTEDELERVLQLKVEENTNNLNEAVMESNSELNFTNLVSLVDLDVDKIVIIKRELVENEKDDDINENGSGE